MISLFRCVYTPYGFLIWTNNFDLCSQDFYDFVALFDSVLKGIIPHLFKKRKKKEKDDGENVLPWCLCFERES